MEGGGAGAAGQTATVLVVDDDEAVRRAVRRILTSRGYAVLEAEHGERALELIAGASKPVDLVLTDVLMPGMGGPQLAARIAATRPQLPVIFMSGYPGDPVQWLQSGNGSRLLLEKPFSADSLAHAVRAALEGRS